MSQTHMTLQMTLSKRSVNDVCESTLTVHVKEPNKSADSLANGASLSSAIWWLNESQHHPNFLLNKKLWLY